MRFEKDFEKDEVKIVLCGIEYMTHLSAELEIDFTPASSGSMRSGGSSYEDLAEAPSPEDVDVMWAETTLTIFNDHGKEIGTLIVKGVGFFETLIDITEEDMNFNAEDLL